MKILIVDGCESVRKELYRTLDDIDEGYKIYHAENGWKGLEVLKKVGDIDIVLTDVDLPEVDGMTFIETIKKCSNFNNLEFVFITEVDCPQMIIKAKKLGISAWIPKPLRPGLLLRIIERMAIRRELMA